MSTTSRAWFGAREVTRDQVLKWEAKRATKNLQKLGRSVPSGDAAALRQAVAGAKVALGREALAQCLAREIRISDRVTRMLARGSGTRRRFSRTDVFVPGARAEQLPTWYLERAEADDEATFLIATPDHHLFRPIEDPRGQEVWETPGGSPLASRFFFAEGNLVGLQTPADPAFPVQMAGSARLADGTLIGGVRHQLRDENGGVRARLTVELPWLIGPHAPAAHRWHLASEFTHWLEAARDAW